MPFAATWMDLEIIILSDVRQRKKNIIWDHYMWNLIFEMIQKSLFAKQTQRFQNQTYGYQRGNIGGRDKLRGWNEHVDITIHKIDK